VVINKLITENMLKLMLKKYMYYYFKGVYLYFYFKAIHTYFYSIYQHTTET